MENPNPAAPVVPPLPEPEGSLQGKKAQLDRIEAALALLLTKVQAMEKEKAAWVAEFRPIIDQLKAKFMDAKTGKIKFWPF